MKERERGWTDTLTYAVYIEEVNEKERDTWQCDKIMRGERRAMTRIMKHTEPLVYSLILQKCHVMTAKVQSTDNNVSECACFVFCGRKFQILLHL